MSWDISLIAVVFASSVAGLGLILNGIALIENSKTRQLQLLNEVFRSIKETELELYKDYKNKDQETKREWDSLLFNSIEEYAFFVNERFIKNKKISGFFDDAVVKWYEQIYLEHYSKEEIEDPKNFPEFKKLYKSIKSKQ
ncbi:MAG: hypothetical protein PHD13_01365 [Methanocellales archaeon]|nr:hypothetical protein [Methanocellales archaeon]MDD3290927.1 hypothetical protein [Methanocellales archaeon]MDD3292329.1 hypothetical protein [Methanocellales archaeon]MDD5234812.1 hypothetical protein [Methanocellales archaeon]MDD5484818.1 hypothetical protein [Methanocellales archaeon]